MSDYLDNAVKKLVGKNGSIFERIEYHKNTTSDISYDSYKKQQILALNEKFIDQKRVYLDTKYWIIFRDIYMGLTNRSDLEVQLYEKLKNLVETDKVICPISTEIFTELHKQKDLKTRYATAELMQLFSKGTTFKFYFEQIDDFIVFFKTCNKEDTFYEKDCCLDHAVHVIGIPEITIGGKEKSHDKKAAWDFFSKLEFKDFIKFSGDPKNDPKEDKTKLIASMIDEKEKHNAKNFADIYRSEFLGGIYHQPEYIDLAISRMKQEKYGNSDITIKPEIRNKFINVLIHSFDTKQLDKHFPLLTVDAGITSVFMHDINRNFKKNDFDDFRHAMIALRNCCYFFTEKSLSHLLNVKPLEYSKRFNIFIESKAKNILDKLEQDFGI